MTHTPVIIHSATIVSDGALVHDGWVEFRDSLVNGRGAGSGWRNRTSSVTDVVDGTGLFLTPGFVDIHVHGGGGFAFLGGPEHTLAALNTHRSYGTTRTVISLVSASVSELELQLAAVHELTEKDALVIGAHLEGPFLHSAFRGAHNENALMFPEPDAVARIIDAAGGSLRQVTLAPELPGALAAIETFLDAGVRVAIGHTSADYEQAREAFNRGASLLTHAFNGMRGIHHRAPGPLVAAIDSPHVILELVADGTHVHFPSARLLTTAAPGRLCLVTDAMAAAGASDGDYQLGTVDVRVTNGVARLREGGSIAGSTLTMNRALGFAVNQMGMTLPSAVASATSVPARALGLPEHWGGLTIGSAADAVLLEANFEVRRVWANGESVATAP